MREETPAGLLCRALTQSDIDIYDKLRILVGIALRSSKQGDLYYFRLKNGEDISVDTDGKFCPF